jgi:proteic killer suppression protein
VIRSFRDKGTENLYDGLESPAARKGCPKDLWSAAQRKLDQVNRATDLHDLSVPPGNMLEKLKGDRNQPTVSDLFPLAEWGCL